MNKSPKKLALQGADFPIKGVVTEGEVYALVGETSDTVVSKWVS